MMNWSIRNSLFFVLCLSMVFSAQAEPKLVKLHQGYKVGGNTIVLADRGNLSPFFVSIFELKKLRGCPTTKGNVIVIRVVDFGEIGDEATYCLAGISGVKTVVLEEIEDKRSQIGWATLVNITFAGKEGDDRLRLRVTPWFAELH